MPTPTKPASPETAQPETEPKSDNQLQNEAIKRSLEDKVRHLSERIEMLKKLPREQGGEALSRTVQTLDNVKESLSKL